MLYELSESALRLAKEKSTPVFIRPQDQHFHEEIGRLQERIVKLENRVAGDSWVPGLFRADHQ